MSLVILLVTLLLTSLNHGASDSNNIITSSCTATLYPDLCYSTITQNVTTTKDVIELTINKTKHTIEANIHTLTNLTTNANITRRGRMALEECLDMEATTLEKLDTAIHYLNEYPPAKSSLLRQYADDLKTLMSTAITNTEICLDGLISYTNKRLRKLITKGQKHERKMCSNVLAMIKNMTDTDIIANNNNPSAYNLKQRRRHRKLKEGNKEIMWPEWLSVGERRSLLFFRIIIPNVVVSKDGKGKYKTIREAVEAAPENSNKRFVIKITAGMYNETVLVPKSKPNIMFLGDGREKTIITGNKSVALSKDTTTTESATVAVLGDKFLARGITFQNTAGPKGQQAVALRVVSDQSAFYKCGIEGYQDTLYVVSNRQFFVKCYIAGTIDFIFGNAAVVFQYCDLMARNPGPNQRNMVTAQGRIEANQNTGIVIHNCKIDATPNLKKVQDKIETYLGRPWKKFSRTVVMRSTIGDVIRKEGWHPWEEDFGLDTLYYREYQNNGPGSNTSNRVKWKGWGVFKDNKEARPFTVANFINGWSWLLSTGFPFWPGL